MKYSEKSERILKIEAVADSITLVVTLLMGIILLFAGEYLYSILMFLLFGIWCCSVALARIIELLEDIK